MTFRKILASFAALLIMVSATSCPVWAVEGDVIGGKAAEEIIKDEAVEEKTEESGTDEDKTEEKPEVSEATEETEATEGKIEEKPEVSEATEETESTEDETDDNSESEEEEEPSAVKEYSVFEAIRIRRDLLAKGNKYTLKDYKNVSSFLVNTSELSARYFTLQYDMQDGDPKEYKNLKVFEPKEVLYKREIVIMANQLEKDGYLSMGWEYNGKFYDGGSVFKMPACNVVMTPVWMKRCKVTYKAGDYEGIIGNKIDTAMSCEGSNYFIADAGRFSRKGYYISAWKCLNDGETYKPGSAFSMPPEDIVFEAVWEPASYSVTISANNAKKDKISLWAVYNSEFVFPECEFENEGRKFVCWKYNKEMYQPGDSFIVPAMLSGSKIVITAVWE